MPLYVGDFIADTAHLSATETGIYIRLIMHCWQHGAIPRDDRVLARIAHCDSRLWRQYRETVLQFFDVESDVSMHHNRVTKELLRYEEISSKRKDAALQKHSKSKANAVQLHTQSQSPLPSKIPEANASGADDPRKRLFSEGLNKLAALTGKGPDSCRSFVGKCLKAADDDAVTVLGLIEDAERNSVADPSSWILARLQKPGATNAKPRSPIIQAADDLVRKLASFDGPARGPDELRGGEGETTPRLLSNG